MKYHCRIWCPDCLGEDPYGCFDGQVEDEVWEPFSTPPQEANKHGWETTRGGIWEYEVVDEHGTTIQVREPPWE